MERELLANYNFGLDEEIDEDLVLKVADYAASIRAGGAPLPAEPYGQPEK